MGSQPKPPDPYDTANAQNQQNYYSAMINSVMGNANQSTPYGTVNNNVSGYVSVKDPITGKMTKIPQWTQTTTLSPEQQRLYNTQTQMQQGLGEFGVQQVGQLKDVLGKPFNAEGLTNWASYGAAPTLRTGAAASGDIRQDQGPTDRAAIEDAIMQSYERSTAGANRAQDAQLAARGMGGGSAMDYRTQVGRQDARGEAARQAYLASGSESRAAQDAYNAAQQQRRGQNVEDVELFNKGTQQNWLNENTRADQQNWRRGAEFGERQQTRNQLVNEIAALLSGSQVTVPQGQAFQGGQVNPFDISGAINNNYNQEMQAYSGRLGGISNIVGSVLGAFNPLGRMFPK